MDEPLEFTKNLTGFLEKHGEAAFETHGSPIPVSGSMLNGYVLICEWMGTDGDYWLTQHHMPGQPYWRTLGYLAGARRGAIDG